MEQRETLTVASLILQGSPIHEFGQKILQDAGRTTVLKHGTLMGKVASSGKWVPFTSETATTGAAWNFGIYDGEDISAAKLVAGDVTASSIIVGGYNLVLNTDLMVVENSKTLDTVIGATTVYATTPRSRLVDRGIYTSDADDLYKGAY